MCTLWPHSHFRTCRFGLAATTRCRSASRFPYKPPDARTNPAGTVIASFGLGVVSKFLEGWTGAVIAKILVLVFIIIFIQRRPQGLFALKGRQADA